MYLINDGKNTGNVRYLIDAAIFQFLTMNAT